MKKQQDQPIQQNKLILWDTPNLTSTKAPRHQTLQVQIIYWGRRMGVSYLNKNAIGVHHVRTTGSERSPHMIFSNQDCPHQCTPILTDKTQCFCHMCACCLCEVTILLFFDLLLAIWWSYWTYWTLWPIIFLHNANHLRESFCLPPKFQWQEAVIPQNGYQNLPKRGSNGCRTGVPDPSSHPMGPGVPSIPIHSSVTIKFLQ